MNYTRILSTALAAVMLLALAPGGRSVHAAPASPLPVDRLHFGIANQPDSLAWMTESRVPWRYRYTYLSGGVNTGGGWQTWQEPGTPGLYATRYLESSRAAGYLPVFSYYMLLQSSPSSGADEAARDYTNLNNPATMSAYYSDFKVLMQRSGAFGGPVVVQVEPDLWGYLQQRSGNTTPDRVAASVASSGNAETVGLPNNAQGFAYALLALRDRYAPNVQMAIHASPWSSMQDIGSSTDPSLDPAAEAARTVTFLNAGGIASNPYGSTWDLVFNDVDDHDAGWWESQGGHHWWDPTNRSFPNFTRYLAWVGALRAGTGRPQVSWQVPIGNQYFLTENNTCGHYQDNVAAYFLAHTADLWSAGLIAVLFGAGNGCQTTNQDTRGDGVTNNNGVPTTDAAGWCNACNTHPSQFADDDGGFLRIFVGQYYAAGVAVADTGRPWTGGSVAVGVAAGAHDAYFAEGYTGPNFHEYLTVQNLSGSAQVLSVDYLGADGRVLTHSYPMPAVGRTTIDVNHEVGPSLSVGAHLYSAGTFVAERPMYFDFNGWTGGHDDVGATTPGTSFYFAEGHTGANFAEYLTLLNPGTGDAAVTITYSLPAGPLPDVVMTVAAHSRATVSVNDAIGPDKDVAMHVASSQPILAERPLYFSLAGLTGGHVAPGARLPATDLVLAEGHVGDGFREYVTILNPSSQVASVDLTFFLGQGAPLLYSLGIAPGARATVPVDSVVPSGSDASLSLHANVGVVAERSMYFSYGPGGWTGGHVAMAVVPDGATSLHFAEGFTGSNFAEWYTVLNRSSQDATVQLTFFDGQGRSWSAALAVPARSRRTFNANALLPAETANSATVTSLGGVPILVERSLYFSY